MQAGWPPNVAAACNLLAHTKDGPRIPRIDAVEAGLGRARGLEWLLVALDMEDSLWQGIWRTGWAPFGCSDCVKAWLVVFVIAVDCPGTESSPFPFHPHHPLPRWTEKALTHPKDRRWGDSAVDCLPADMAFNLAGNEDPLLQLTSKRWGRLRRCACVH